MKKKTHKPPLPRNLLDKYGLTHRLLARDTADGCEEELARSRDPLVPAQLKTMENGSVTVHTPTRDGYEGRSGDGAEGRWRIRGGETEET